MPAAGADFQPALPPRTFGDNPQQANPKSCSKAASGLTPPLARFKLSPEIKFARQLYGRERAYFCSQGLAPTPDNGCARLCHGGIPANNKTPPAASNASRTKPALQPQNTGLNLVMLGTIS